MFSRGINDQLRYRRLKRKLRHKARQAGLFAAAAVSILLLVVVLIPYAKQRLEGHPAELKTQQAVSNGSQAVREIRSAIESGRYEQAQTLLKQAIARQPDDRAFGELTSQLRDELAVNFEFHYLPGRRQQLARTEVGPALVLTAEDPYYLTLNASDRCNLYVFQVDNSGKFTRLFPNPDFVPTTNPVPPGALRIPDGFDWFYLDQVPGIETIYLVASRWRQTELEKLSGRLAENSDNPDLHKASLQRLLARLQEQKQATDTLPGLVYGEYRFTHK